MTSQTVSCSQCHAPIAIVDDQRYCQCEHCGSKLFIAQTESGELQPEGFESILQQPLDAASLRAAKRRLASLESEIPNAEEDAHKRTSELEEASSAHRESLRSCQKAVSPMRNWTYVAGLLAAIGWFVALFLLQDGDRKMALAIALLLTIAARGFRLEWRDVEEQAETKLYESRERVRQAKVARQEALTLWESGRLERELCQRAILRHDSTRKTGAVGA